MSSVCLQLYFQPKIDVGTNVTIGYEILLRNKDYPPYYPAVKMEEVYYNEEQHTLFLEWLQKDITRVLKKYPEISLSVNFSPRQLLYSETKQFFRAMKQFADQLIVEITEDSIFLEVTEEKKIKHIEKEIEDTLAFIKEQGYLISLDDVGTGRNSFERALEYASYLSQIKFSIVKCVRQNASPEMIDFFLKAWHRFAIENQIDIVVEGIEDKDMSEKLVKDGLILQQGYYFGKPAAEMILESN
ncbi:EAL domain-containing protein [Desemzia sp. RIT804]|uniref:EAL domain-containing protein n=1 Tax=Desemzia sp. RIT 804 TaxID=2810209 RepID=UPI001951E6FD|nr:EAL domain-containing protein [Desemzia sp. RIT 804]MBM6613298.1 EAL domain-containing protein [Desemzia sp. RIT 804]